MGFDRYFITIWAIDRVNLNFESEENRWPFWGNCSNDAVYWWREASLVAACQFDWTLMIDPTNMIDKIKVLMIWLANQTRSKLGGVNNKKEKEQNAIVFNKNNWFALTVDWIIQPIFDSSLATVHAKMKMIIKKKNFVRRIFCTGVLPSSWA